MNYHLVGSKGGVLEFIQRFFVERTPYVKERNQQHFVILNIITFFGLFTHASWIFLFGFIGVLPLALFNCISVLLWLTSIYLNRRGWHLASMSVGLLEAVAHQTLCVILIGWGAGFQYYVLLLPVGLYLTPHGHNRIKMFLSLLCLSVFCILDFYFRGTEPIYRLGALPLNLFNYSNIIIFVVLTSFGCYYFTEKVYEAERALSEEHKKSEALLLNILPKSIAERLKSSSEVIADRFENVSIIFLDIVKFTSISEKLSAQKVVAFLNNLFLIFDDLTEKYKLEKIKTIGDAYMVAAGIPEPCDDHAERVALMSIDITNSLKEYNKENGDNVKVRIGINSGPAVAGVIGKKKFAYDIWGDTVNTASRMEAYGEPGEIQVSEATYHLLKDKYNFMYRGVINVKGKGDLPTYFLKR